MTTYPAAFEEYFGVADEIYQSLVRRPPLDQDVSALEQVGLDQLADVGCTLADLDSDAIAAAKRWADANGAPWPPYLPWAEDFALDRANGRIR